MRTRAHAGARPRERRSTRAGGPPGGCAPRGSASMTTFTMPDLGEGLQEAEIVTWHVETGERVVADQPLVSVETDKAVVEVPAPVSGTITRLHAEIGDVVAVGARLVDFDTDEKRQDSGVIVGKLETETTPIAEDVPVTARQAGVAPSSRVRIFGAAFCDRSLAGCGVSIIMGRINPFPRV